MSSYTSGADAEREVLLRYFLMFPPPWVRLQLTEAAESSPSSREATIASLNLRDVKLPKEVLDALCSAGPAAPPAAVSWDLRAVCATSQSQRTSSRRGPSVFALGWSRFAERFPSRALPPFAEESLRSLELRKLSKQPAAVAQLAPLSTPRVSAKSPPPTLAGGKPTVIPTTRPPPLRTQQSNVAERAVSPSSVDALLAGDDGRMGPASGSKGPSTLIHRHRAASREPDMSEAALLGSLNPSPSTCSATRTPPPASSICLAEMAVCRSRKPPSLEPPACFPNPPLIETFSVAHCSVVEQLLEDMVSFNSFVYDHVLLSIGLLLHPEAPAVARVVLDVVRPALGISESMHASVMHRLATDEQLVHVELTATPSELRFANVEISKPKANMHRWIATHERRLSGPQDADSNSDFGGSGVLGQSSNELRFAAAATRLVDALATETKTASSSPHAADMPPTVAAVLMAGLLQVGFVHQLDPEYPTPSVDEDELIPLIHMVQRFLGVDDATMPFCRMHALLLAQRSVLPMSVTQLKATMIQTNYFDRLVDQLSMVNTLGLETLPLEGEVQYRVLVLQDVVDSTLTPMQWMSSIEDEGLCRSLCMAFCSVCTALPPLFLSVFIRVDGEPLGCGKAVDSALMELLAHFVGAALLQEVGDAQEWLDPSLRLTLLIEMVSRATASSMTFLRILKAYLPFASALAVPMMVRIVSYLFGLYWGRTARDASSATAPTDFEEATRLVHHAVSQHVQGDVVGCEGILDLLSDHMERHFAWLMPLYVRYMDHVEERLNERIAAVSNLDWGKDSAANDEAVERVMLLVMGPLPVIHHTLLGIGVVELLCQRWLVMAVGAMGRLAARICGPLLLPTTSEMLCDRPEQFVPPGVAVPAPLASPSSHSPVPQQLGGLSAAASSYRALYPMQIHVAKESAVRAQRLKAELQDRPPIDILSRLKYEHVLRTRLRYAVETFYVSVWNAVLFRRRRKPLTKDSSDDPVAAAVTPVTRSEGVSQEGLTATSATALLSDPTLATLKSLVEEALSQMQRFCSDLADALALKVVYYGSLHQTMNDKFLKTDMKFYRAHKYDKKFLMSEGKNAHIRLMFPNVTMASILDTIEQDLRNFLRHADGLETIVNINAHIFEHLTSVLMFLVLDGGEERCFYPELGASLLSDVTLMENFFTANLPDIESPRGAPSHHTDHPHHHHPAGSSSPQWPGGTHGGSDSDSDSGVPILWELVSAKDSIDASRWWLRGKDVVGSLRTILSTVFSAPSEDLLSGTPQTPPYHALPEISSDSAWCRFIARRVLMHRKDAAAKKFCRSLS